MLYANYMVVRAVPAIGASAKVTHMLHGATLFFNIDHFSATSLFLIFCIHSISFHFIRPANFTDPWFLKRNDSRPPL